MRRGTALLVLAVFIIQPAASQSVDILSPGSENWQDTSFNVQVDDENVSSCAYMVRDDDAWSSRQSRSCSDSFTVDLPSDCGTDGFRTCEVNVSATNSTGFTVYERRNFSIGESPCPEAIACYTMEEGSGQYVYDRSGNGFHMMLGNTTGPDPHDPEWSNDCVNSRSTCLNFSDTDGDGVGNHFTRLAVSKRMELRNLSIMSWARVRNFSSTLDLAMVSREFSYKLSIGNLNTPQEKKLLAATFNNTVCDPGAWCGDDNRNWEESDIEVSRDKWNKLGYVFNGTDYIFYSNGKQADVQGTTKIPDNGYDTAYINNPGYPYSVGARDPLAQGGGTSYYFRGTIDDTYIFNKTIDLAKVGTDLEVCTPERSGSYQDWRRDLDSERLIEDSEYCKQDSTGTYWMDQDYSREACASRWISSTQVASQPQAFTGGIDDDYYTGFDANFVSKPYENSWSSGESPLHSGNLSRSRNISTLGFCLGDDRGENRVTQICRSSLCETNRSVTAASVSAKSCAYRQPGGRIEVYSQGESLNLPDGTIACFGGAFYSNWPVSAVESTSEIVEGRSNNVQFQIINVDDRQRRFKLSKEGGAARMASFYDLPDDREIVVPPNTMKTVSLEVFGSQEVDGRQLTIQAVSRSTDISGTDSVTLDLTSRSFDSEPNSVPGISLIHLLLVGAAATLLVSQRSAL